MDGQLAAWKPRRVDDAELVVSARAGDADALAAIYDRYADRIHDFCRSILRSQDDAADAMQDTFVLAAEKIDTLREPERLRPWLYAIARHRSFRILEQRRRVSGDVPEDLAGLEEEPMRALSQEETTTLVWDAAAALSERDRTVLDLALRHGADAPEIAEVLGVKARNPYSLLNRVKAQADRAISALLVARVGRDECPELDAILTSSDWSGEITPLLRKRISRHIERCEVCTETRRQQVKPLALLSAAPIVAAAPQLRDTVVERMVAARASGEANAARSEAWQADGFPPATARPLGRAARSVAVAAAVAVGVTTLVVGGWVAFGDTGSTDTSAAPAGAAFETSTPTPRPTTASVVSSSTSTTAPAELVAPSAAAGAEPQVATQPPPATDAPSQTPSATAPPPTEAPGPEPPPAPSPPPTPTTVPATTTTVPVTSITLFTVLPSPVSCDESTFITMSWATGNADEVVLSIDGPGAYDTYGPAGSEPVPFACDGEQHTYLLTANGPYGSSQQTIVVSQA